VKKIAILICFLFSFWLFLACEPTTTIDTLNNDISATNDDDVTKITDTSTTASCTVDTDNADPTATDDSCTITKDTSISTSTNTSTTAGSGMN